MEVSRTPIHLHGMSFEVLSSSTRQVLPLVSDAGVQNERAGLMKSANKGLLFLDEIGELGRDKQAMCPRAIEEKRFLPVGADRDVTSDFQLREAHDLQEFSRAPEACKIGIVIRSDRVGWSM